MTKTNLILAGIVTGLGLIACNVSKTDNTVKALDDHKNEILNCDIKLTHWDNNNLVTNDMRFNHSFEIKETKEINDPAKVPMIVIGGGEYDSIMVVNIYGKGGFVDGSDIEDGGVVSISHKATNDLNFKDEHLFAYDLRAGKIFVYTRVSLPELNINGKSVNKMELLCKSDAKPVEAVNYECKDQALAAVLAHLNIDEKEFFTRNDEIFFCKSKEAPHKEIYQWGDGSGLVGTEYEIQSGKCVQTEAPYTGQDDGDLDIEWAVSYCQGWEDF